MRQKGVLTYLNVIALELFMAQLACPDTAKRVAKFEISEQVYKNH
jgi:hypothetical protein